MNEKKWKRKSVVREYVEAIVIAVVLTLIVRAFVIQAFRIPTGSMMDTLLVGDFLFVNKFIYGAKV
ncbi:MAG: signal peptidase I, partial [Candidatus Eiseniibacteriota bacterium]